MDFYVHLPSSSSADYYPNNSASSYRTKLPTPISFPELYEVALTEFSFINNIVQFSSPTQNVILVVSKQPVTREVKVVDSITPKAQTANPLERSSAEATNTSTQPPSTGTQASTTSTPTRAPETQSQEVSKTAVVTKTETTIEETYRHLSLDHKFYDSVNVLVDEINKKFRASLGGSVKISYYKNLNRVEIVLGQFVESVILTERIRVLLGFKSTRLLREPGENSETFLAEGPPDFNFCATRLFVYCDILQSQVVGNIYAPLLFSLALERQDKRVITVNPIRSYINVGRLNFDSIKIFILNEYGEEVVFHNGASSVTLHFRPKIHNGTRPI